METKDFLGGLALILSVPLDKRHEMFCFKPRTLDSTAVVRVEVCGEGE